MRRWWHKTNSSRRPEDSNPMHTTTASTLNSTLFLQQFFVPIFFHHNLLVLLLHQLYYYSRSSFPPPDAAPAGLGPTPCLLQLSITDRPLPDDEPLPNRAQQQVVAVEALRNLIHVQNEDEVFLNSTHLTWMICLKISVIYNLSDKLAIWNEMEFRRR